MKNKLYLLLLISSTLIYSQEIDSVKVDSTKIIKLKAVAVKSNLNKAGVYELVLPKKILENETLDKTIKRASFVTIDNSKSIYFKGKKIDNIIFNNKPITIEEFNKLSIEDVRSIQIDANNFNQATGEIESVIRISEKKKTTNNIKGSLDYSQGFFQKFNYYGLSLSNKINKLSSRLQISNINNSTNNTTKQEINGDILSSENNRKLTQPYLSIQNVYDIDEKSTIYMKNKYSIVDENIFTKFSNYDNLDYIFKIKNYSMNLRYDRKLKDNLNLKLNFDFINFNNNIRSNLININQVLASKQNFNELTFSPLLQKKGTKYDLINSFVATNRKYRFTNTQNNNSINQNILTYFINYLLKINDNNSLSVGSRYQFEKNDFLNKENHHFLPNITYLTKLDSIAEFEINYKRKLQRPSINTISSSNYLDSNGNTVINQSFLLPQIDDLITLDISKEFKKININLAINYNHSKNYITNIYNFNNQNLVYSTSNIDTYVEKSIKTSLSFSVWKESRLNLNYSISDIELNKNSFKSKGVINYYDVSLSGPIFKNYLLSLNSFFIDRYYDFNLFTNAKPDFSFSISKNYLKEKLNLNLEFRSILNQDNNRNLSFNNDMNYYNLNTKNQSRLLLLSLTYNFGKDFKMTKKNIQNTNSDMKLK